MGNFEDRENRRKSAVIGEMVDSAAVPAAFRRGRPKEDREIKKRVSLSVLPSLYTDIQKIAYVERRSVSDLIGELLEQYRAQHGEELVEYKKITYSEEESDDSMPI